MKIYEIGTGYTPIPAAMGAATEIVVEELTKAFLCREHQVEIIDIATTNRLPHSLPIKSVKVPGCFSNTDVQLGIMHKLKRVVYSIALAGELRRILKASHEKVILHFHNQYNLFFFLKLVPKRLRNKCIIAYTNHSGIWRLPWNEIEDTIKKRYFQEAVCMKNADLVFLLNQETKENVLTHLGIPESQIVLIGNGVNTEIYHPLTDAEKQNAKEKYELAGKKVILQVGSVYENKGQLRAAALLMPMMKSSADLVYAYAGGIVDEEYHTALQQFAQENGIANQVRYLGTIPPGKALNELYNTASATILPSRYEGFPLVVVESLSAGIPVLLDADSPIHFGQGEIAYSSSCIENSMQRLDNKLDYDTLCTDARMTAVTEYGWGKIAEDYAAAFEKRITWQRS